MPAGAAVLRSRSATRLPQTTRRPRHPSRMNASNRYQSQELYLQQSDISCYRGVDPLTGLAVLIYTFPGRPTAAAGGLESENVPGILASGVDDAVGQVVAAYSPHYRPITTDTVVDDRVVLEVLRGVRDAARFGVPHGDLRAGRLLHAQGHVLIEGYGVPWHPVDPDATAPEVAAGARPSLAADVYAVAATLLQLGGEHISNAVRRTLRTALASDPDDRPTASALLTMVRRAGGGAVTSPSRSFDELTLPTGAAAPGGAAPDAPPAAAASDAQESRDRRLSATRSDFQLDLDFELEVASSSATGTQEQARAAPQAPAPVNVDAADRYDDEPDPITLHSDPGLDGEGPVIGKHPTFVKAPPPGATYRAGSVDETVPPAPIRLDLPPPKERRRSWRGPLLLLGALVVGGGLAALAFLWQGGTAPAPSAGNGLNYIVSVQVQPANLPPVDLYVAKSPPGSGTPAGTILCRAPCKVVLDRKGDWQFVAQFQGRRSAPADVTLPGQRSVVVTFPAGAGVGGGG